MLYLDNSATTIPFQEVISTYSKVTETYFANPSSLHKLGSEAETLLYQARSQVATLLGVLQEEVIFTSGGTEGNNIAIKGAALGNKQKGKHIITTMIEHPSVLESFKQLEIVHNFNVTYLPANEEGIVSIEQIKKELREDTILVSIMHVNNEVGMIQPITEIGKLLNKYPNVLFHVDHVQGMTKVPLDFKKSYIDLCTISGHKFHGLNGTGALYVRKGVTLLPLFSGGAQELQLRSGTENLAGNVSFAKALRMAIEEAEQQQITLMKARNKMMDELLKIEGIVINTPKENSAPHIVNFSIPTVKAEVLVHFLAEHDIFVSTTSACSSRRKSISNTLLAMKKSQEIAKSAIRVSLSLEQTEDIVKPFIKVLTLGIEKLSKVMG